MKKTILDVIESMPHFDYTYAKFRHFVFPVRDVIKVLELALCSKIIHFTATLTNGRQSFQIRRCALGSRRKRNKMVHVEDAKIK